jgi:hypothetical protein
MPKPGFCFKSITKLIHKPWINIGREFFNFKYIKANTATWNKEGAQYPTEAKFYLDPPIFHKPLEESDNNLKNLKIIGKDFLKDFQRGTYINGINSQTIAQNSQKILPLIQKQIPEISIQQLSPVHQGNYYIFMAPISKNLNSYNKINGYNKTFQPKHSNLSFLNIYPSDDGGVNLLVYYRYNSLKEEKSELGYHPPVISPENGAMIGKFKIHPTGQLELRNSMSSNEFLLNTFRKGEAPVEKTHKKLDKMAKQNKQLEFQAECYVKLKQKSEPDTPEMKLKTKFFDYVLEHKKLPQDLELLLSGITKQVSPRNSGASSLSNILDKEFDYDIQLLTSPFDEKLDKEESKDILHALKRGINQTTCFLYRHTPNPEEPSPIQSLSQWQYILISPEQPLPIKTGHISESELIRHIFPVEEAAASCFKTLLLNFIHDDSVSRYNQEGHRTSAKEIFRVNFTRRQKENLRMMLIPHMPKPLKGIARNHNNTLWKNCIKTYQLKQTLNSLKNVIVKIQPAKTHRFLPSFFRTHTFIPGEPNNPIKPLFNLREIKLQFKHAAATIQTDRHFCQFNVTNRPAHNRSLLKKVATDTLKIAQTLGIKNLDLTEALGINLNATQKEFIKTLCQEAERMGLQLIRYNRETGQYLKVSSQNLKQENTAINEKLIYQGK